MSFLGSENLVLTKLCSIEFEVQQLRRQINSRIDTLEKKIFEFSRDVPRPTAFKDVPLFLADLPAKNDVELMRINELIEANGRDMDELVTKC